MQNQGTTTRRATGLRCRRGPHALWVIALLLMPLAGLAETVRDDFEDRAFDNNDGSVDWAGDWIEVDDDSPGPNNGAIRIRNQGELQINNRRGETVEPSAAREVDLTGAIAATLTFDWETTNGVDDDDSITLEISDDGGSSWTTLEVFDNIDGGDDGSESYDIVAFASDETQIRFRVDNEYEGRGEHFRIEFVEIDFTVALTGADLSVTQSDSPDPVNVASPLAYTLTVSNSGPEAATNVVVTDTLPATVTHVSSTATQGSCLHAAGTVTCTLGNLAIGTSATINIVVTAPFLTGSITNSASVSGDQSDPVAANDTSTENTQVQNLNVNQLCYLVADSGGAGGTDLFTEVDTSDFNPATNETNIGTSTGTTTIEAIAFNSTTGVVYAADEDRLGTLNTSTGVFQPLPQLFGSGDGSDGSEDFDDVDGLTYDATTGVLYGSHARGGNDLLFQINMTTGAHVPNAFGAGVDYVEIGDIAGGTIVDDIAVDPTTGIMYAATNNGGSTDRLIIVNKTTGAATNVALITVPDIEGLGTDPSGQLWGTSGTQGILYEISKTTGVGANGRTINNGSDYEAVDCYATSPTVVADLVVDKSVDEAAPQESDTVVYTVTVNNTGPGPATVVQVSDLLPAGVTFVSATQTQGTYDGTTGDWFVGSLPLGANATLTIDATVDASTGGTTITNTASIAFLSQVDPDSSNDTASVDVIPLGSAILSISKSVRPIDAPVSGPGGPYAIPGATMLYEIEVVNSGTGPVDADSLVITDAVPTGMVLRVTDFDGSTDGPVAFDPGTAPNSLTYTFAALDDLGDDVEFTEDGGIDNYEYEPVPDGRGADSNITHIRIRPKGSLLGNTGSGNPTAELQLLMILE